MLHSSISFHHLHLEEEVVRELLKHRLELRVVERHQLLERARDVRGARLELDLELEKDELGHGQYGTVHRATNKVYCLKQIVMEAYSDDERALAALNGAGAAGHPQDRPESRRLYRLCANMGGYPDGLPCTFELLAMEVAWVLGYV